MTLYYQVIKAIFKTLLIEANLAVAHSPQCSLYCTCELKCHGS